MNVEQQLLDTSQMRSTFPEWLCDLLENAADEIILLRRRLDLMVGDD